MNREFIDQNYTIKTISENMHILIYDEFTQAQKTFNDFILLLN